MNSAKRRRECIAMARYANRYAHIPDVLIGRWAMVRKVNRGLARGEYYRVRRQQKHHFMSGYRVDKDSASE